jgi:hypothetical protein
MFPSPGRSHEPGHGGCCGGGGGGSAGWPLLAEWAGPASAPSPGRPAHPPQEPAGVVPAEADGAAGLRPAAAAAGPGGAEACGSAGGRAGCDSDWDPFHDDWHAW